MTTLNVSQRPKILTTLIFLTFLIITTQITFFVIHYKVSDIFDSLIQSSLQQQFFHFPILLPIFEFIGIQLFSYAVLILWTWLATHSVSDYFHLASLSTRLLSFIIFGNNCLLILSLNNYYFPYSFFAELVPLPFLILTFSLGLFVFLNMLIVLNTVQNNLYKKSVSFFLLIGFLLSMTHLHTEIKLKTVSQKQIYSTPNIILIGLDSLRPDFISHLNQHAVQTPHIDNFLKNSTFFTEAYTPLARTFTSWMSILTAEHPLHSNARNNLADPLSIHTQNTLATVLKNEGYETIYATDEKRFSNITERYGFDKILGPRLGINDFILGNLTDFPLTNLLINTALGKFIFPYNFANRAAAITYDPDKFLELVQLGLLERTQKPLFLAVHLCISHWPFTWAQSGPRSTNIVQKYQLSVQAIDRQLGSLLNILKKHHLLDHSIVVLLSDHGTTLGLPNDRVISKNHFLGNPKKLSSLLVYRLSSANEESFDFKNDYSISTSYGQGTDVLSLKQYHVLLAFKGFGLRTIPRLVNTPVSLMDITPTLLDFLKFPSLPKIDGLSLKNYLTSTILPKNRMNRLFFLETGHTIAEIETNDIFIEKVLKNTISLYAVFPSSGQLFVKPEAEKSIIRSKQRAVILGDWILAYYPQMTRSKLVLVPLKNDPSKKTFSFKPYITPSFLVIANLKTKQWDIGLDSDFAKHAPSKMLLKKLQEFYGAEME